MLEGRVLGPSAPAWCEARGWTEFLLGLDEDTLEACERGDLGERLASHPAAPASLLALASELAAATALEQLGPHPAAIPARRAGARKIAQVAALAGALGGWAPHLSRIVDVGAGHGHLTRALAEALDLAALGLERELARVEMARTLTEDPRVRFEARAIGAAVEGLGPRDLLVGLHACGALGDAVIRAAVEGGAAVLLVPCCAQKILEDARAPLSARGRALGLTFDRATLGLANLTLAAEGGVDAEGVMARRQTRYALYRLLSDAGVALSPGDEMRGLNRRRARLPLAELARLAFTARGLPMPSPTRVAELEAIAEAEHGRIRRLALPRSLFARALEVALALDRAVALEEAGREATVVEAFSRAHSPRNLAVLAAPADRG